LVGSKQQQGKLASHGGQIGSDCDRLAKQPLGIVVSTEAAGQFPHQADRAQVEWIVAKQSVQMPLGIRQIAAVHGLRGGDKPWIMQQRGR